MSTNNNKCSCCCNKPTVCDKPGYNSYFTGEIVEDILEKSRYLQLKELVGDEIYKDRISQYIGETDETKGLYKGSFYLCVLENGVYAWKYISGRNAEESNGAVWKNIKTEELEENINFYKTQTPYDRSKNNASLVAENDAVGLDPKDVEKKFDETEALYIERLEKIYNIKKDEDETLQHFVDRTYNTFSKLGTTYQDDKLIGTTRASNLYLQNDIIVAGLESQFGAGGYENGDIILKGTSLEEILIKILSKEIYPDINITQGTALADFLKPNLKVTLSNGKVLDNDDKLKENIIKVGSIINIKTSTNPIVFTTTNSEIKSFKVDKLITGYYYPTVDEKDPNKVKSYVFNKKSDIIIGDNDASNNPSNFVGDDFWKHTIIPKLPAVKVYYEINLNRDNLTFIPPAESAGIAEIINNKGKDKAFIEQQSYKNEQAGTIKIISSEQTPDATSYLPGIKSCLIVSNFNNTSKLEVTSEIPAVDKVHNLPMKSNSCTLYSVLPIFTNGIFKTFSSDINTDVKNLSLDRVWPQESLGGNEVIEIDTLHNYIVNDLFALYAEYCTKNTITNNMFVNVLVPITYEVTKVTSKRDTFDAYDVPAGKDSWNFYLERDILGNPALIYKTINGLSCSYHRYYVRSDEYPAGNNLFKIIIKKIIKNEKI